MSKPFRADSVRALQHALHEGDPLVCPECGTPLDQRAVPPRRDVSYVRDRLWLVCPTCHGTAVLDRRDRP
ncbi:MAG: hypothetical protein RJQ04_06595 [Longimicrobiales bacterium]